ncbi:putative argonaute-like protein [Boletus reticuloceps]|uniref:Putative argonaute-like protein n=1 Tax=Boletus reticuloceps TaxID=495285 RepID=A0A8I2YDB7_9AGAM|nr:putative argonaute-like protein [Boletus reticuloceps]
MSSASSSSRQWQVQGRGGRGMGRGRGDLVAARGTWPSHPRGANFNRGDRDRGTGRGRFETRRGMQGQPSSGASVHLPPWHPGTLTDSVLGHNSIFMQGRPVAVDARIKDGSDMAVVAGLDRQTGAGTGLPLRLDFGTQGRAIALRANYFPVDVKGSIYRYSVAIAIHGDKNLKMSRRVKHRVFQLAEQTVDWQQAGMSGRVAHDNAERLVACILLPQPLIIHGAYYDEGEEGPPSVGGREYTLTLEFEEEVDQEILNECLAGGPVDSQALAKVLSALNLVLTAHPSRTGVKIGRGDDTKKHPDQRLFFDSPDPKDIGGGLTVREGFYVSVRPAHQQLMVNVNTCHAAFYKPQNFKVALDEYNRLVKGGLGAFGKQVRVVTQPNKHTVMIQGVSKQNARQKKFKHNDFGLITIEQYYKLKYDIELKSPECVLLEDSKGNLYPPEVCDILPDQGFKGELTSSKHATEMLNVACKLPKVNANEIVNRGINLLGFRDWNPVLDSFGVSVGTDMATVPGRVLDKPGLSYSSDKRATIDDRASWNLRDVRFAVGARLDKWAVLVIQDGGRSDFKGAKDLELRKITDEFRNMCIKSGMQVRTLEERAYAEVRLPFRDNKGANRFRDDAIEVIERTMRSLIGKVAPDLVLVMLSNDDAAIYNGLKWLCDVKLDIATVCIQSEKVRKDRGQPQYFANVALKVNMKMGGINHTLDAKSGAWLKSASTMIMGMDVTHPARGPSLEGTPSIVAVVASVDEHFAQYPAALAIRRSKVEIDRDQDNGDGALRDMFISRFELYRAHNDGKLPERVILYRDGVSESQFMQVRQYELKQMKKAFEHFDSYQPKLSIVICGKRHHTRFYPTKPEDAAVDGNPLPGTVVDRGVTPAYEFDFFLQPHGSLKGTARPTHYYVVHDENGFNADGLQRLTNDLSYMFQRATKAVSLVSPAYWADIACERGRCYLHKLLQGDKDGGEAAKDNKGKKGKKRPEDTVFEKAEDMWGDGVSGPRLRDTMFYL